MYNTNCLSRYFHLIPLLFQALLSFHHHPIPQEPSFPPLENFKALLIYICYIFYVVKFWTFSSKTFVECYILAHKLKRLDYFFK